MEQIDTTQDEYPLWLEQLDMGDDENGDPIIVRRDLTYEAIGDDDCGHPLYVWMPR